MLDGIGDVVYYRGLEFKESKDISFLNNSDAKMQSQENDSWLRFESKEGIKLLSVSIDVEPECYMPGDAVRIYYSSGDDPLSFSEDRLKVIPIEGCLTICKIFEFDSQIHGIRVDPTERAGDLPIARIEISGFASCDAFFSCIFPVVNGCGQNGTVVLLHDLSFTGAPILAYNICLEMHKRGNPFIAFYISDYGTGIKEGFDEHDLPIFPLYFPQVEGMEERERFTARMLLWLNQSGYKSAILNTVISGGLAGQFKKSGFNVTTLIHETIESVEAFSWQTDVYETAMFSDYVVFPSDQVREGYYKLIHSFCGQTVVRPQGVYLKQSSKNASVQALQTLGIGEDVFFVLGSGTVDLRKGTDLFISAGISLAGKWRSSQKLCIAWFGNGQHDYIRWLQAQIENSVGAGIVRLFPAVSTDVYAQLLSRANAFWCTSRNDTYPSVILEAMSAHVPVFGFRGSTGADSMLAQGRGVLIDDFSSEDLAVETQGFAEGKIDLSKEVFNASCWIDTSFVFSDYVDFLLELCNIKHMIDPSYAKELLAPWGYTSDQSSIVPIGKVIDGDVLLNVLNTNKRRGG